MFTRHPLNPLISPADVTPSRAGFEVIGAFNAGVIEYGGETLLLVRVAERPTSAPTGMIASPYLAEDGDLTIRHIRRDDPDYDTRDTRKVNHRATGELYLTSISHLRLARSRDGVHFTVDPKPFLAPATREEAFGVEDARITLIDDTYYINYTAVSPRGVATALASTHDFKTVERQGIIFPPANRDVSLFPARIKGQYHCHHRPMPGMFGTYDIWSATSPDLIHWGEYKVILQATADGWESGRVGGGAPPLWTEEGWLSIYHAADRNDRYCLGAFLTAHDDPSHVIARSRTPIFEPDAPYEREGFFGNVVFSCGALLRGETLLIYYGAADEHTALAEAPLANVLTMLERI